MIKFPFTSLQQLNLDWIMQTLHKILDIIPMNGVAGDVLQRTVDGAAWQPLAAVSLDIHSMTAMTDAVAGNDELPIYDDSLQGNYKVEVSDLMLQAPVQSVNGQTGDVVLTAADVSALPDTTVIPTDTSDLTNTAGFVDAAGAAAAAPVQSVNGQTGAVVTKDLFFDNVQDPVTISIDTSLDPSNDAVIDNQNVFLMKDPDKKVIRLCGYFRTTSGSNLGWRTFVTNVQDIADLPVGRTYIHCDWTCDIYDVISGLRSYVISGSNVNFRVRDDKTIVIYVHFNEANKAYRVVFNSVPVQISY